MRGSHPLRIAYCVRAGIIPAHAGLTIGKRTASYFGRDHPRACGAHSTDCGAGSRASGSSPRMRGSRQANLVTKFSLGIIPAHAGLTNLPADSCKGRWDHPRACGAHKSSCHSTGLGVESSPRMRGSRKEQEKEVIADGIIPAHAGLTARDVVRHCCGWDHPRACGAHGGSACRKSL